jgi:hypothetical protein
MTCPKWSAAQANHVHCSTNQRVTSEWPEPICTRVFVAGVVLRSFVEDDPDGIGTGRRGEVHGW